MTTRHSGANYDVNEKRMNQMSSALDSDTVKMEANRVKHGEYYGRERLTEQGA